jgi:hypothetical protein
MKIDPDDIYARNQLAEILTANGGREDRQEAIVLLKGTIENKPSDGYAHGLLELIQKTPEGTPVSIELAVEEPNEISEDEELAVVEGVGIEPTQLIPDNIAKWGATRRLRFKLDNGSGTEKKAALKQVTEMLQDGPSAYVKLLAVRQGVWVENGDQVTGFAFAFERALREQDQVTLEMLSERFPRLIALTIVARAIFGDKQSVAKIANLMSVDDFSLHPAARALKRRMVPHLALIRGGQPVEIVLTERKNEIIAALHDANEAALPEPAIAA